MEPDVLERERELGVGQRGGSGFLALPDDVIRLVLGHLTLPSLALFAAACTRTATIVAHRDTWAARLKRHLPELPPPPPDVHPRDRFRSLLRVQSDFFRSIGQTVLPCTTGGGCGGSLEYSCDATYATSSGETGDAASNGVAGCPQLQRRVRGRCPCVAARVRLPLAVGSLSARRCGDSALESGGFRELGQLLSTFFTLRPGSAAAGDGPYFLSLDTLTDPRLVSLDVLVLCTTQSDPLTADELAALRRWTLAGGALIANGFANWSTHEHYNRRTVGWMNVETLPGWPFERFHSHELRQSELRSARLDGPFTTPREFRNRGESALLAPTLWVDTPRSLVFESALRLCDYGRLDRPSISSFATGNALAYGGMSAEEEQEEYDAFLHRVSTLLYVPPGYLVERVRTLRRLDSTGYEMDGKVAYAGKGRALVCGNLHWIADAGFWNSGLLHQNEPLILNFVAGALAARGDVWADVSAADEIEVGKCPGLWQVTVGEDPLATLEFPYTT